jgi:hypothetical protein
MKNEARNLSVAYVRAPMHFARQLLLFYSSYLTLSYRLQRSRDAGLLALTTVQNMKAAETRVIIIILESDTFRSRICKADTLHLLLWKSKYNKYFEVLNIKTYSYMIGLISFHVQTFIGTHYVLRGKPHLRDIRRSHDSNNVGVGLLDCKATWTCTHKRFGGTCCLHLQGYIRRTISAFPPL